MPTKKKPVKKIIKKPSKKVAVKKSVKKTADKIVATSTKDVVVAPVVDASGVVMIVPVHNDISNY